VGHWVDCNGWAAELAELAGLAGLACPFQGVRFALHFRIDLEPEWC
jgi:hypothetical protein